MNTLTKSLLSITVLSAAIAMGCGSGSGSSDATGTGGTGAGGAGGTDPCGGITLFGLSTGDTCFDVVAVQSGSSDGCGLGVADTSANGIVGQALPVNYDMSTANLTVGTSGSLGAGTIMCNVGTLTRANDPALDTMTSCTHHQTDTSMVTVTATNEFDIAVTEDQTMFATACSATNTPAGGMCTSTWTWHMKKNAAKTPPNCD